MKTLKELGFDVYCSNQSYIEWHNNEEDARISYDAFSETIYCRFISRMIPLPVKPEEMYAVLEEVKKFENLRRS